MLEVRTYEGSPEELAKFVVSQWTASYGGRMAVPDWSGDYFRWQLRMDEPEQRQHLIAAYDGAQLAGVVPHFPMQFSLDGEKFSASQASWLSVAPEFRGQGVAGKLIQGSRAIHRELGAEIPARIRLLRSSVITGPKVLAAITDHHHCGNPQCRILGAGSGFPAGCAVEPEHLPAMGHKADLTGLHGPPDLLSTKSSHSACGAE